jgi:FtsP/CotA-like multicopper oxidase with cupredoxin domain
MPHSKHEPKTSRRNFLTAAMGSSGLAFAHRHSLATDLAKGKSDLTLQVGRISLEVAKGRTVTTTGYNGSVPGPLIRLREGVHTSVEIVNDTNESEYVHWHGQDIPADVDGAQEERSLVVPRRGRLRYEFTPGPSGSRYIHTHNMSMGNLSRGVFNGQFAFVFVEPKDDLGDYDKEIFLATHEWEPHLAAMEQHDDNSVELRRESEPETSSGQGWEVAYRYYTINGRCLGLGAPLKVKEGQRILFRILNASATESVRLALPHHRFQIVALDGNHVPNPRSVEVLEFATAERVDAIVEMNAPGVWILGTPNAAHRRKGMGIVVEYANRGTTPVWVNPNMGRWDYTMFGANSPARQPEETIPIVIRRMRPGKDGFERWTLNGKSFDAHGAPRRLAKGVRHRFIFDNQSDDAHPLHFHRTSFEVVRVGNRTTSGLMKDVISVPNKSSVEVDVTPSIEGLLLFHCHQQLHMDNGFKMLFDVV